MTAKYDLAGEVIGLGMKVHRKLGAGFLEGVYKKALQYELIRAGHSAEMEVQIQVRYEGVVVGDYLADLLVDGELIVEIKAVASLSATHEVQLVNYLTATGRNEGLLLNFGARSLEYKKKYRTYKPSISKDVSLQENSVNSVNSVQK